MWPFRAWDSKQPPVRWCGGVCADMGGCHHILWGRRFQTVWTLYLHLNLDTCTKEYTVSSPGWGCGAAPPDLGTLHSWASVWHCQAVPLPNLGPFPEPACLLRPHFQDMRDCQLPQSPGVIWKGVSHRYGYSYSQLTPIKARDKVTRLTATSGQGDPTHTPTGLQGDLEETGGSRCPAPALLPVPLPLEASVSR